jgi:hypothetical protein
MKNLILIVLAFIFLFSIAYAVPKVIVDLQKSIVYKMNGHKWVDLSFREKKIYVIGFLSAFYWANSDDQDARDRVLAISRRKLKLIVLMVDDFYKFRSNRDYQLAFPVFDAWIMFAGSNEKEMK